LRILSSYENENFDDFDGKSPSGRREMLRVFVSGISKMYDIERSLKWASEPSPSLAFHNFKYLLKLCNVLEDYEIPERSLLSPLESSNSHLSSCQAPNAPNDLA
jgi:hypothetical protein